jgi:hypothetical protein
MTILEFMNKWEGVWLFLILFPEMIAGIYSAWILKREFDYDEKKDLDKKQKRTKTTKKTTTQPGGASVTEESTETVESTGQKDEKNGTIS